LSRLSGLYCLAGNYATGCFDQRAVHKCDLKPGQVNRCRPDTPVRHPVSHTVYLPQRCLCIDHPRPMLDTRSQLVAFVAGHGKKGVVHVQWYEDPLLNQLNIGLSCGTLQRQAKESKTDIRVRELLTGGLTSGT